jgi:hypothetical protein
MTAPTRTKPRHFTVLLITLIVLLVVHPLIDLDAPDVAPLFSAVRGVVFVAAICTIWQDKRARPWAILLGLPALLADFTNSIFFAAAPPAVIVTVHCFPVLFLGYAFVWSLHSIFQDRIVSADTISGALCGYLLLGFAFGHLYCAIEALRPGSFVVATDVGPLPADLSRRFSFFCYYSFMTLTTVGYGDVVPRSPPARAFAILEAIVGQAYVAVIIASLVAMNVSASARGPGSEQTTIVGLK